MSDRSFRESEESTSALNGQDTESSSNAKRTNTDDEFSHDTGRESPVLRTWQMWMLHGFNSTAMTGRGEARAAEPAEVVRSLDTTGGFATYQGGNLISSAEDSPAKTSPSLDKDEDSQATDQDSSSSSHESLTLFSPMQDGSSLRTFPDFFPPTVDEISQSYSRRWPSSGFTTSPGECWTADTSECPSGAGASSSLPDVLEAEVHPRFYLSQRAAAGILRRADRRGKDLPEALKTALIS